MSIINFIGHTIKIMSIINFIEKKGLALVHSSNPYAVFYSLLEPVRV